MFTTMDDDGEISMVAEPSPDYTYTYADYLTWKFEERLELFRGKIFKMAGPTVRHQEVVANMYLVIGSYLKGKDCKVFLSPIDVRLPVQNRKKDNEITTIVQPDLCIVCDPSKIERRGIVGAPDLVVEVLSPGNSRKEIKLKHELYEEAGVGEYWVVNAEEQNIICYRLNDEGKLALHTVLTPGDIVTLRAVPGLQINIADIFDN